MAYMASPLALRSSAQLSSLARASATTPSSSTTHFTCHSGAANSRFCSKRAPVGLGLALRNSTTTCRRISNSSSPSRTANTSSSTSSSSGSFSVVTSRCSTFMKGDSGSIFSILPPSLAPIKERISTCPRASAGEDVPAFKGFPPMTEKPKWFWRVLACIPYLMPLSETWMYAETAYSLFPFLEDYEFCTYPFLILIGSLPGWFLLAYFFGAYLGIVRNNRWPHFLRFHVVTGMLLEIILQVMGTVNDWVPQSVYWGKLGAHYWLAVSIAFLFIVLDCIRCALNGMYADVPFLSDASYMQIPYE